MWTCNVCGAAIEDDENFCECGAPKPIYDDNYCTNPDCERYKKILSNPERSRCGKCGKLTVFGQKIEDLI